MLDQCRKISFRIIHADDQTFLRNLYATTRAWEFALTIWPEDEKRDFLRRQFDAQDLHYTRVFPKAVRRIICLDDIDIGRLYVDRRDDEMHIIELSLLPAFQGRGIGTDILRSLLNEAHGGKVPVRLKVERQNPAVRLYQRHGFSTISASGHHLSMEWHPDRRG
ncbi:MAG: GNAT family N-acetyltransferase [Salipiger thiooxidans]|uniref:GNAT family N-acetyltransferase n=1 Tax=Salipiger thiooxidans TaxID=282683 RepID=UPI001CF9F7FE|nr:GNAT family N-acetyltransferase [Salipiger thiooxidans]